jgi:hypothetical protein
MKIIKNFVSIDYGKKTIMFDPDINRYFLVSTINYEKYHGPVTKIYNETAVFDCSEDGKIANYEERYMLIPANHDKVVNLLLNKKLVFVI